jgi:hypothetical protein
MRDKRPDADDPHFQRVPVEIEDDRNGAVGRFVLAAVICAIPFSVIGVLVALWPHEKIELEPAQAPTAEVAPADVEDADAEAPADPDPAETLRAAQSRVVELEDQLAVREKELADTKAQVGSSNAVSDDLEKEVATLRKSLSRARGDRDKLKSDLETALAELSVEEAAHAETRHTAAVLAQANDQNAWVAFTRQADIELCNQLTTRGRAKCRTKLDAWFDESRRDRFTRCVDADRTLPKLWHVGDDAEPPPYSEPVQAPGVRDGVFVVYCDPTLPESQVAEATPLPTLR